MSKKGWLLYESQDALKNRWFIEKVQSECKAYGLEPELVFTDFITDAYTMNLMSIADELLKQKDTPAFIINRSRNSDIAYELENRGIRIFNPARVSDISNDKDLSYQFVDKLKLPYMPYIVINSEEYLPLCGNESGFSMSGREEFISIANKAADFGYPFVLKPSDGHGGQNVYLIEDSTMLQNAFQNICTNYLKNPYKKILFQRCAATPGKDLRVYVLNNQVVVGMLRRSITPGDFRANFSLGGNASMHTLTREERFLTDEIAEAMPSDFIGIDFVYDKNGIPVFNEIEDAVGSRMVYASTNIDIIKSFVGHIATNVD